MGKQDLPIDLIEPVEQATAKSQAALALVQVQGTMTEIDRVEAGLDSLRTKYQNVAYAVGTAEGMKDAKAARIEVREIRYAIDKVANSSKDALNALKKDIDGRALEIKTELVALETPIHEQIKAEEDRVAAEKEAIKAAKAAAAAAAQSSIDAIRAMAIQAVSLSAAGIDALRTELDGMELLNEVLGERTGEALQAKMQTLDTLDSLHGAAVKREAAEAQAAIDRAELDAMRAAQAEADRKAEAARKAEADAAQTRRDEANRLADEAMAAQRAAFDKEMADKRAALQADADKLAAEQAEKRAALQAETDRLAAEQAKLDKAKRIEQKRKDDAIEAKRVEAEKQAAQARAAEQKRLDDEAAAQRLEADRLAAEKRAAEEAAHQADQRGRDAWRVMLAALQAAYKDLEF
ncbi:MAG: hypothetical protein JWP27_3041, partial [Flaviaesturariibacter sp.]|nr:hypothetical protein [Flaviaesturariibacter sp.]